MVKQLGTSSSIGEAIEKILTFNLGLDGCPRESVKIILEDFLSNRFQVAMVKTDTLEEAERLKKLYEDILK